MENNELAKRELGGQSFIERLIEKTDSLEEVRKVGMVIIESGFCPEHFKQSKDAVGAIMCIEAGRKLGLSWMQSLSDIYPVKGRIGIMGTAAKAVIFASGVLESWKEYTEGEWPDPKYKHITESKRKGLPDVFRTEFSVFDAQTAGLMGKEIYKKYGKRMIAWRDIGFHASDYYQDILKGMKTVEELNDYDGLVPGTPEKVTLKTEDGKELTFTDKDKERSAKTTSRVTSKIPENKFNKVGDENITEATIVDDKPPFIADKNSAEYMNGVLVCRDEYGNITNKEEIDLAGAGTDSEGKEKIPEQPWTLDQMEKMDTEILKKVVMEDLDMMEASEIIPGKNTNKKLRDIIFAHQEGKLDLHVAPYLKEKEKEENKAGEAAPSDVSPQNSSADIPPNKGFDKAAEDKKIDDFLNGTSKKEEKPVAEAGNKYGLEIPAYDKGEQRDFSTTKTLYNRIVGITPQITSVRYLELAQKTGLIEKYADKETFCRDATVEEINQLLNAN